MRARLGPRVLARDQGDGTAAVLLCVLGFGSGGRTAKADKLIMNPSRTAADARPLLLVLEGDAAVRDSLKFSLEAEEFEVRAYASPDELLKDEDLPRNICLIVHYHLNRLNHMARVNGLDVIAKLRERRTSMPALLMTGRPDETLRQRASAAGVPIVEKPLQGTELTQCLRALLKAPADPSAEEPRSRSDINAR